MDKKEEDKEYRKEMIEGSSIALILILFACFAAFLAYHSNQKYQARQDRIIRVKKNEIKKYGNLQAKKRVTKQEFLRVFNVANKHNNKELLNKINGLEIYDPKSKHHYITHTNYRKNNSNYSLMPID